MEIVTEISGFVWVNNGKQPLKDSMEISVKTRLFWRNGKENF